MKILPVNSEAVLPRLTGSRLARHFSPDELRQIVSYCDLIEYEAGELIIKEQAVDQHMYVVTRNSVVIEIESPEHPVYVDTLGEGEIIGEAGLFINAKRTANVRSADEAQLLRMSRDRFLTLLREQSRIGTKMMFMIIYGLLSRLRSANEELAFERRLDAPQEDIDALIAEMIPSETVRALDGLP